MAELPFLKLPDPTQVKPPRGFGGGGNAIRTPGRARQEQRLGPKFERLTRVLPHPEQLNELRNDPAAIAPERALVFEIASSAVEFDLARRNIPGLEFLGEDEDEIHPDEDFFVAEKPDKQVTRRIYFTMPDMRALEEIVRLWNLYRRGEELERGKKQWKKVFDHLKDVRRWGPQDRITEDTKKDWRERLAMHPDDPFRFEVELWFRSAPATRGAAQQRLTNFVNSTEGRILDQSLIAEIRYHALLVEVRPEFIREILDNADVEIATFDEIMLLRPQSNVTSPQEDNFDEVFDADDAYNESPTQEPQAALLDGLPMAQHQHLAQRLSIDDPDDYGALYGQAGEQRHGTNMASIIIHGDLNNPAPESPIRSRLYVRPVMYPQQGPNGTQEAMHPDKLVIDVIWRSVIRMFDGEDGDNPTAPAVKVINLSIGDYKRRFSGVLSPWARLIDHLVWTYKVLILISAGNITDSVQLEDVQNWGEFENLTPQERESALITAILRNRADRKLLSPSESVNALTIGACHTDRITPPNHSGLAIDPYESSHIPNLSSALGLGYFRGVKPEILFPGGREYVRINNTIPLEISPSFQSGLYFGIRAASPGTAGETNKCLNFSGTSVATALATNSALKILQALEEFPQEVVHPSIEDDFKAVVVKALLVHGSKWNPELAERILEISEQHGSSYWGHQREDVARLLGFGAVDISRSLECVENRATLIGQSLIHANETHQFCIPLPSAIENTAGFRAVTTTIGWFTPLNAAHRKYRMAKIEVEPGNDGLSLGVKNAKSQPSHHSFGKGTVYHRRWEGEKAKAFLDDGNILLNVTCRPTTGSLDEPIPYGIAVTIEVGEDVDVRVYQEIKERLRLMVTTPVET